MRHPYRTVPLVVAAVVLLTGCSNSYTFKLLLTVTNSDDGKPVEGVRAVLDTDILAEERKEQLDARFPIGITNEQGELTHIFHYGGYSNSAGPWYLKLQKEGFETQVIDISPKKDYPNRDVNVPLPLSVTVEMKPLPKKP